MNSLLFKYIENCLLRLFCSCLTALGGIWLFIESYIVISGKTQSPLSYCCFLIISISIGIILFIIDGILLSGFLRKQIIIKSNAFNTVIIIKFGDIFKLGNIVAIGVNDFFDSKVDGNIVSEESLHGKMLCTYWPTIKDDWDSQVENELSGAQYIKENRPTGKCKRYPIGTTAETKTTDGKRFLCVSLSRTDNSSLQTRASSADLNVALRGMLTKARSVCGNKPLTIPLMGGGLSRIDLKPIILLNLLITAIFEESRNRRITSSIYIILPWKNFLEINLSIIKQSWS